MMFSAVRAAMVASFLFSFLLGTGTSLSAQQSSWSQFLGPARNGISTEQVPLVDKFPAAGPTEKWRVPGGEGLSGFACSGKLAITTANIGGSQQAIALDIESGKTVWSVALGRGYKNQMGGSGPRATPTIDGDMVFVFTGEGILSAHETGTGTQKWKLDLPTLMKTKPSEYGMASSPLVVGDSVIVHVGGAQGAVVAINKTSGKGLWKTAAGPAGYSSPMLLEIGDAKEKHVVALLGDKVVGIDPSGGKQLWSYEYVTDYACNTANPIAVDGDVLISSGENHGSVLLDVSGEGGAYKVTETWESLGPKSSIRSEWQTPLLIDGYLYGFDNVGSAGAISHLVCVNAKTGEQVWREARFGKGNLILADGKVLMTTFEGEIVLGKVSTAGYEELSRAKVVGQNRQAPALTGGLVLVRDKQEFVCLDLRK